MFKKALSVVLGATVLAVFTLVQTKKKVVFKVAHIENYIEDLSFKPFIKDRHAATGQIQASHDIK